MGLSETFLSSFLKLQNEPLILPTKGPWFCCVYVSCMELTLVDMCAPLGRVGSAASKYLPKRTPWCLGLRPPTHLFLHDLSVCTVPARGSSHPRLTWLGLSALSWALISSLGCLPGQVSSNSAFPSWDSQVKGFYISLLFL